MAMHLRGVDREGQGMIGRTLENRSGQDVGLEEEARQKVVLTNRAQESRSPYVRAHSRNPVAWQIWDDDTIDLARKENRLLFVSIGYNACHCECLTHSSWCTGS